ncbi:MAG: SCO family protein [Gammaproteobacteria bacterium]|nr:SCO family protein [Gammaproteobacteria bacterium]
MSSTPTGRQLALALGLAVLAGSAGFLLARHAAQPQPGSIEGLIWPDPRALAAFSAIDHDGGPFTEEKLKGRWSLLFFGFTHCPDICPITLSVLAQARKGLGNATGGAPLQVIFVTVDPERDQPPQLKEYVRYFDPEFIGLGGTPEQIRGLTSQLGVAVMRNPGTPDGAYTVDHSAAVFVIDPGARFVGVLSAPHEKDSMTLRFRNIAEFVRRAES